MSVPVNKNIKLNPIIKNATELRKEIPNRVIFAYKGNSIETIERCIEDYRVNSPELSQSFPDLIIVNNSYFI
jgi:hypothetical protein